VPDDAWKRQEKRLAQKTGGRRQPGSGSGWLHPNDVRTENMLWECKTTDAQSFTIKIADWEKLRSNALRSGRKPGMHITIGKRRLVVFDEADVSDGG
jgi:hypothetical protein